jgi:uncharacterized protein YhdP
MRKVLKLIGFASVTLVLFFIVASVAFYHLVHVGEFRRFLIDEIEKNTALKVELGEAGLEIGWITGIVFRQVAIAEPDAAQPAITAESVTARVALTPLLQRKVVFYEIRLQKPVAQFVGDQDGRIPLLDKLLNLPFLNQPDHEFQLDLRAVKVLNAAIEFTDPRPDSGIGTWRLLNADVNIERVRGQRLRDFVKDLLQRGAPGSAAALEFSFRGAVEKDHDKMNVKADGRLLFPKEVLEFHEARWIADLEVVELPAALIKEYAARRVPIKTMTGHFAQRVHLDGNPTRQMRLKGELDFRQLAIDAPELLLAPLAGADGRTSFELDWTRQRLQLTRADFRTNDIKFSLHGEVRALDGDNPHLNLTVSALSAPLPALRKYLPVKVAQMPRLERALDGIQAGQVEIKKAGVNASVGALRRLAETGVGKQLWFDAEIRDAAGKLPVDNTLPLRAVQGRIKLENGLLTFDNIRGNYGDSRLTDVDGSYDLVPAGGGKLDLHAVGDFNLAELREQLKSAMFPAQAAKVASSVQELGGRGKADLTIKSAPDTPIQFGGKAVLDNARVRYGDYSLSEIRGELQFSPKEIKGEKIRAQLRGSPVQIQLTLSDYTSDNGAFDLTVESTDMRAGVITGLLLDTGSLQDPGIVRGLVRYRGPFLNKEARRLTGNLDLVNVQLALQPLLQPLRELNGKIQIDETGIDFQNLKALLVGFPASASGRWRYAEKPQLLFDFAAPNLDVSYLISQVDPEASEFYATLQALGKIALGRGRLRNFEFTDLKTDAAIDRRVWRLTNLTARAGGGAITGVTTVVDKPDTLGIVTEPKIQAVPIEVFLKWFNITNTEMTGKVVLVGKLETVGKDDADRKQNLNGAFHLRIEDGTINRMRLLVQLLNLLDLSRWFTLQLPDLTKEGIRFRAITGDFKVVKGVYSTENLVVDSNDLRMTGAGKIDVPKDELDFVVAVRPFAGIDTALNYIPLLGRSVAAIKNSFLVASFNIKGPIDNPTITPAPLGTLTEWFWGVLGIPKSIIGLGEGESKEEPKEPVKAPATK